MTSWTRQAVGFVAAAVALMACGGAPDKSNADPASQGLVACDQNCGGGGGGVAIPPTAVRLAAFEDSGVSGNYYEIRQTFFNAANQSVSYNPQK